MGKINDGGLAFPVLEKSYVDRDDYTRYQTEGGMTLRDYFAAKALESFVSEHNVAFIIAVNKGTTTQIIARASYAMADAMIAAREAAND